MYATAPSWQLSDTPASAKSDDKVHSDGRSSDPGKTPAVDADTIVAKNPAHNVTPVYNALPPAPAPQGISLPEVPGSQPATLPESECPAPDFTLTVAQSSSSNRNLYIVAAPVTNDPGSRAGCGGVEFDAPVITYPINGHFCDQSLSVIASNAWSTDCSLQGGTAYGTYTFTFSVTGTNGYDLSTSRSKNLTYYYYP